MGCFPYCIFVMVESVNVDTGLLLNPQLAKVPSSPLVQMQNQDILIMTFLIGSTCYTDSTVHGSSTCTYVLYITKLYRYCCSFMSSF